MYVILMLILLQILYLNSGQWVFFKFSDKRLILNYLFIPMNILIVAILKASGLGLVIIILVSSALRTILISLAAILGKSMI